LAGVLLLPKPKRELSAAVGPVWFSRDAYSITAIKVDVSGETEEGGIVLRPTDLLLENAGHDGAQIIFAERMSRVIRLWETASGSTNLEKAIRRHQDAVTGDAPDHKQIEHCASAIAELVNTKEDPLPLAEYALSIEHTAPALQTAPAAQLRSTTFSEDDRLTQFEARLERVKQWRAVAVRGHAGRKFRNQVMRHYDHRCVFSGDRLPKMTDVTDSAGVDAAHILPWSTHNINIVPNGLCLNKLCHWAFDAGVFRLDFFEGINQYVLQIPESVREAASRHSFDLDYFERLTGPVPRARLPSDQSEWPAPTALNRLNQVMFG